jgi:CRISPR system Cascade subunit CasC
MFVELHMIQNFSPSNLNRDDANNPKDCEFGGYRRARVSSQCIKRAIREDPLFEQTTGVDNGKRTKWLATWIRQPLLDAGKLKDEVDAVAVNFAKTYAKKMDSKNKTRTQVLVYMSPSEVQDAIAALLANWSEVQPSSKESDKVIGGIVGDLIKKYAKITSAPDIALFGRMLADQPTTKLEAACQVAHAISTHAVAMEMDFWTAVDDLQHLQPSDTIGAAMMGYTGFNSACFYRYARIDLGQLEENLNGDADLARRTVEGFMRATVNAVPSGMQNSHAANNPPSFLLAVVRQDGMGWSLANAFVRPVRPRHDVDVVAVSVAELERYWDRLCTVFGDQTLVRVAALAVDPNMTLTFLDEQQVKNVEEWVAAVAEALPAGEEAA